MQAVRGERGKGDRVNTTKAGMRIVLSGALALFMTAATACVQALAPGGHLQQAQAKTLTAKGRYAFNCDSSYKARAGCYVRKMKLTGKKLTVWGSIKKVKNRTYTKATKKKAGKYSFKITKNTVFHSGDMMTLAYSKSCVKRCNSNKNNNTTVQVVVKNGKATSVAFFDSDLCWEATTTG